MINALLIDGNPEFLRALTSSLEDLGCIRVVGAVAGSDEAHPVLRTHDVDVVLLTFTPVDARLFESVRQVRKPSPLVFVLADELHPELAAAAVSAGAVGVLHKTVSAETLVASLQGMLSRAVVPRQTGSASDQESSFVAGGRNGSAAGLTPRQLEVLIGMAEGLDNSAIAERLSIGEETVRSHVSHILHRFGVQSRLKAVIHGLRYGHIALGDINTDRDE